MSSTQTTDAAKPRWRNFLSELRRPTNTGGQFFRAAGIVLTIGLVYFKVIKPTIYAHKFCREESFAQSLFEQEQRLKNRDKEQDPY